MQIRIDDLTGPAARGLVAAHLAGMRATSPAESVHALDIGALRSDAVTFWSAWIDGEIAGIAALRTLDAERGEIKSMRVAEGFLGRGVGRALLEHIVHAARERGMASLWLETGTGEPFAAALRLYERAGFLPCPPFADYRPDPFSVFLTLDLRGSGGDDESDGEG